MQPASGYGYALLIFLTLLMHEALLPFNRCECLKNGLVYCGIKFPDSGPDKLKRFIGFDAHSLLEHIDAVYLNIKQLGNFKFGVDTLGHTR